MGEVTLHCVRAVAVEHWLRRLQRADGAPLANPTKAKIRNIFSGLFNHAIRCEWLEQGRNPIVLVRQSAKRMSVPEVLLSSEIQALLGQLDASSRLMVTLAVTTGLRRSELCSALGGREFLEIAKPKPHSKRCRSRNASRPTSGYGKIRRGMGVRTTGSFPATVTGAKLRAGRAW
jgi:hypothetical protein